jgi:hypothetical protein
LYHTPSHLAYCWHLYTHKVRLIISKIISFIHSWYFRDHFIPGL